MGTKRKYPINRWDVCCNCGKFCLNVITKYEESIRPHYCNKKCKSERHGKARRGEVPPITPRKELNRKYKRRQEIKKIEEELAREEAELDASGRRRPEAIKGPTPYEEQLWGNK